MSFLVLRTRNDNSFVFLWRGLTALTNYFVSSCRAISFPTTFVIPSRQARNLLHHYHDKTSCTH